MLHQFQLSATDSGLDFDIDLEPGKRLYCFVGENAVGKTALLESLGQVIWWMHAVWQGEELREGSFEGWTARHFFRERFKSLVLRVPDILWNGQPIKQREDWGATEPLGATHISPPIEELVDQPFVFVSAQQRASLSNLGSEALSLVGDRASAFTDAIERGLSASRREPVSTTAPITWLSARLLVNPSFVVGMHNPQHEVAELLRLMQRFDPESFEGLVTEGGGRVKLAVTYKDGKVHILGRPVDRLASGWVALLRILQEIVSSIAAWEAMRDRSDILASDALIFIDEIDAHLHPRWQARLLPFLKESFPNATFVVTTHSPLLVRDTEPGEGYELVREGDRVTSRRLGSPRDWYLTDVLADAFHVQLPPPGSESVGDQPPLTSVLLDYAQKVREHSASKDPATREEALRLYEAAVARVPEDDPRRRSLDQLRQLLG